MRPLGVLSENFPLIYLSVLAKGLRGSAANACNVSYVPSIAHADEVYDTVVARVLGEKIAVQSVLGMRTSLGHEQRPQGRRAGLFVHFFVLAEGLRSGLANTINV